MRYDASHITVLTAWEAIRKRPGMYVGSTSEHGLHNAVFEVADWAAEEVLAGRAARVDIALTAEQAVRVAHDGPGVPFEDGDEPGLETRLTCGQAGSASSGRRGALVGRFGIGLCVPNALSSRLTAVVRRDGMRWVQEYARGVAAGPPAAVGPTTETGTSLTFWPDPGIFSTIRCSFDRLADRLRELALLNRGLDVTLTDQRSHPPRVARLRFPGGTREFVALLDTEPGPLVHPDVIGFEREEPGMAGSMEVAFRWHEAPEERFRSFANSLPTAPGGTHAEGFRDGVAAAISDCARRLGLLPSTVPDVRPDQIRNGLTAVVSVNLDAPELEGATRGVLGNAAVRPCVAKAVRDHLATWLDDHPDQAAAITRHILWAARGRTA